MQTMIFAAGKGTRLKPITDTKPKALVSVGGRTLLEQVIGRLSEAGADRIVVNVHHFAEQIKAFLNERGNFGMDIRLSDETVQLLDTGGGLRKAAPLFRHDENILIHNVDIVSDVDLPELYRQAEGADATLLVSERKSSRQLLFSEDMRLVGWTNVDTGEIKSPYPKLNPDDCRKYAFAGIHVFSPKLFPLMADRPDKFGIIDFYLDACRKADIRGNVAKGVSIIDVGKPETLNKFHGVKF